MAGWTSSIWPLSTHPRITKQHLDEISAAIVERGDLINSGWSGYTYTYRNYRNILADPSILVGFKAAVKNMITGGSSHGQRFTPKQATGNFNAYFAAHTGVAARPPITTVEILEDLKIPTNYFDYTPYRGLSGCGFVSDSEGVNGVAGYQNDDTAAGGSVFPTGRTHWTTSDYGFDNIKHILSKLCWISYGQDYLPWQVVRDAGYRGDGKDANWSTAKTEAETNYATSTLVGLIGEAHRFTLGYKDVVGGFWALVESMVWHSEQTYVHDGTMHCDTDFYHYAEARSTGDHAVYDAYGLPNIIEGQHAIVATKVWDGTSGAWPTANPSPSYGSSDMPSPWCDEPSYHSPTEYYNRGNKVMAKFCIYRFDITGGLEYV